MQQDDIRWEQRFANFKKAIDKLTQAVEYIAQHPQGKNSVLNEVFKEGLIQRFEYTHELAWNVMKDYAKYQGIQNIGGSRDATREAFQLHLISENDAQIWMDMIGSRNLSSHTYNEETSDEIYFKILSSYHPAFVDFQKKMEELKNGYTQGELF